MPTSRNKQWQNMGREKHS